MSTDLEVYRRRAIVALRAAGPSIKAVACDTLGLPVTAVYAVGSVVDAARFTEASDIDVAIVVRAPYMRSGLSQELSMKMQQAMLRRPMGELGVINTLVFIGMQSARGRVSRLV